MKKLKQVPMLLVALSMLLQAQAPKIGDAIRQAKPPKEVSEPKAKTLIRVEGLKPSYKPELKKGKVLKKVLVKEFKITGNIHIKSEVFLPLLKTYKNQMLSFNDMQKIASIITKKYRSYGYIVARAYIPVQNMNDKILEISIIEGVYGKFKLTNNSKLKTSILQNMLDTNKEGRVVNNDSLERALLIVNDMPGIVVLNATIKTGDKVGSSDFLITVDNSKAYNGYVLVNNYGGRYTGKKQLIAGVNFLNPLGIGDKLSLSGLISNKADLLNGSVIYSVPLNQYGLRGEVGYTNTSYSLSEEFANLDAQGSSQSFFMRVTYPVIKKRAESLNLSLKLDKNLLTDEIKSTNFKSNKTLSAYRVGLDYTKSDLDLFKLNQFLHTSMTFTNGKLEFKDTTQRTLDKAGVDTEGVFYKLKLAFNYNVNFTKKLSLENSLSFQQALWDKNLDGSEDFSVGGTYGVKLYPSGELSAENGYLYSAQIKYALPSKNALSHQVGLFYDIGKAYMQNPIATFQSRVLQDIGLGYYAGYKKFFGNIQVAWKIDNENITSEPDESYKLLFMGGVSF